ncbi:hypothetical protein D3C72_839310 [compost metagenome]
MTAVGDDDLVCRDGRSAVEHQARDLLTQLFTPLQHVIAQHFRRVVLRDAAHLAPQGFQAWLGQIRRAAAKGDHLAIAARIEQHHYFIPLGDVHRALHRAGHRRNGRQGFFLRDKIA